MVTGTGIDGPVVTRRRGKPIKTTIMVMSAILKIKEGKGNMPRRGKPTKTTAMVMSAILKIKEEGKGHKMATPINRKVRKKTEDKAETTAAVEVVDKVEVGDKVEVADEAEVGDEAEARLEAVARTQSEDPIINKAHQRTSSSITWHEERLARCWG